MGYPNYKIKFYNVELNYDIRHTRDSGSNFILYGVPWVEYPSTQYITVIINGEKPSIPELTYLQKLDNKIFLANKKLIEKYITGKELKIHACNNTGVYRVHLWDSITTTNFSYPENSTPYNLINAIEAFNFEDIVEMNGKEYTYIKFSFTKDKLTFALLDKIMDEIILVNYDKVSTKPTKTYHVKYPTNFYHYTESNSLLKGDIVTIHSDYNNQVNYYGVSYHRPYKGTEKGFNSLVDSIIPNLEKYKLELIELKTSIEIKTKELNNHKNKLEKQNNKLLKLVTYELNVYSQQLEDLVKKETSVLSTNLNRLSQDEAYIQQYIDAIILAKGIL